MKIAMIGVGMGNPALLTQQAQDAIAASDCIAGASRLVEHFEGGKRILAATSPEEIAAFFAAQPQSVSGAVLVSGDVGFYSTTKRLLSALEGHELSLICGISSLQYFASKLCTSWEDAKVVSMHGRAGNPVGNIYTHQKTFLLTGGEVRAQHICSKLCDAGLGALVVSVGENLSYENERIVTGSARQLAAQEFESLAVMMVLNDCPLEADNVHGLDDDRFLRGNVPMTKSEVRSVVISKLCPRVEDVLYDIGAGTGSVSVELALQAFRGTVYAVEYKEEALELIAQNKAQFGVKNLRIIAGKAPEALRDLPPPHGAFIGGSAGNLREIIGLLLEKNPSVRIVITAIALETLAEAVACVRDFEMVHVDIAQVSVAKAKLLGGYHMMMGQNPVTVVTAQGRG